MALLKNFDTPPLRGASQDLFFLACGLFFCLGPPPPPTRIYLFCSRLFGKLDGDGFLGGTWFQPGFILKKFAPPLFPWGWVGAMGRMGVVGSFHPPPWGWVVLWGTPTPLPKVPKARKWPFSSEKFLGQQAPGSKTKPPPRGGGYLLWAAMGNHWVG